MRPSDGPVGRSLLDCEIDLDRRVVLDALLMKNSFKKGSRSPGQREVGVGVTETRLAQIENRRSCLSGFRSTFGNHDVPWLQVAMAERLGIPTRPVPLIAVMDLTHGSHDRRDPSSEISDIEVAARSLDSDSSQKSSEVLTLRPTHENG